MPTSRSPTTERPPTRDRRNRRRVGRRELLRTVGAVSIPVVGGCLDADETGTESIVSIANDSDDDRAVACLVHDATTDARLLENVVTVAPDARRQLAFTVERDASDDGHLLWAVVRIDGVDGFDDFDRVEGPSDPAEPDSLNAWRGSIERDGLAGTATGRFPESVAGLSGTITARGTVDLETDQG